MPGLLTRYLSNTRKHVSQLVHMPEMLFRDSYNRNNFPTSHQRHSGCQAVKAEARLSPSVRVVMYVRPEHQIMRDMEVTIMAYIPLVK